MLAFAVGVCAIIFFVLGYIIGTSIADEQWESVIDDINRSLDKLGKK